MENKSMDRLSLQSMPPWAKRAAQLIELVTPWTLFLVLLSVGWRVDLFNAIPAYGDVLEVTWGIIWYDSHLLDGHLSFFPLIFYPGGWNVATYSYGPGLFIPLIPLFKFGGAAFAYNAAVLLSFLVAFAGMYLLTKKLTLSSFTATLASLLFTFWGVRWIKIGGALNFLIGSSLLPWMIFGIERALDKSRRSNVWFIFVGIIWAWAIANSLYFLWIGGLVLLGWVVGRCVSGQVSWRDAFKGVSISTFVALLVNIPYFLWYYQGIKVAGFSSFGIDNLNYWGASLNSIPIPSVFNPWLQPVALWIYRGLADESGVANFGLVAFLVALHSLRGIGQDKTRWSALILSAVGIVLAMGLTLKWDGASRRWDALRPLDSIIWQVAHFLKPGLFPSTLPPAPFDNAIPMPGLLLTAIVPFFEGARVLSRFAFVAGVGFFLLVSQQVAQIRNWIARLALTVLLIFEVIPFPFGGVPFPPPIHPAFEWLAQQSLSGDSIIDAYAPKPYTLSLPNGGEVLAATLYHQKPTVAGASAIWPGSTGLLYAWLAQHPHPFQSPEFIPLLRKYRARFILLQMHGKNEQDILEEARDNKEIEMIQCFPPPQGQSPWNYPICVLKILSP